MRKIGDYYGQGERGVKEEQLLNGHSLLSSRKIF